MAGITPVNQSTTTSSNTTTNDAAISSQLGPSAFLQLLTTELANQNPLNPVDQTQSLAQLAQFSTLQSQDNLATAFGKFQSNFAVSQAAGLVGANVTATVTNAAGNSSSVSGTINGITVQNGTPYYTLVDPTTGKQIVDSSGNTITISQSQITAITGNVIAPTSGSIGTGTTNTGSNGTQLRSTGG